MRRTVYTGDGRTVGESADVRDRMWLDSKPANLGEWQEWLRRHGIEPNEVLLSWRDQAGWIERQENLYRVAWLGLPATPAVPGTERYVQLEGKPMPFPEWRAARRTPVIDLG
jgi:hypothetical protein